MIYGVFDSDSVWAGGVSRPATCSRTAGRGMRMPSERCSSSIFRAGTCSAAALAAAVLFGSWGPVLIRKALLELGEGGQKGLERRTDKERFQTLISANSILNAYLLTGKIQFS